MTVYVDQVRNYGGSANFRWTRSCHMYADTLEELHLMAGWIGMKRDWFQDKPRLPHYDLTPARRVLALKHGAVEQTMKEMVEFMRKAKQ